MVVPHGSEALRSWSVSERAVRGAAWGGILLAAIFLTGAGTIVRQMWYLGNRPAMAATPNDGTNADGEVGALRARVATLTTALDTIRDADARLHAVAGGKASRADSVAILLQARTDSLLRSARDVKKGYGTLADSATAARRGRNRGSEISVSRANR